MSVSQWVCCMQIGVLISVPASNFYLVLLQCATGTGCFSFFSWNKESKFKLFFSQQEFNLGRILPFLYLFFFFFFLFGFVVHWIGAAFTLRIEQGGMMRWVGVLWGYSQCNTLNLKQNVQSKHGFCKGCEWCGRDRAHSHAVCVAIRRKKCVSKWFFHTVSLL